VKNYLKIRDPSIFQGSLKKKSYYEGWYFKLVNSELDRVIAFIPTVALNNEENRRVCFIQILDGLNSNVYYFEYPISEFWSSDSQFLIKIGKNYFSKEKIILNIHKNQSDIKGEIQLKNLISIPNSLFSPGAMGPFSYLPFMQTYHGIISMDHQIRGELNFNGEMINYGNGSKGYTEKDWGASFPNAWIWIQTNHFREDRRSFMLSVAEIPWMGYKFIGFLSFIWDRGKIYRFATYTGAKIRKIFPGKDQVKIIIEDKNNILIIKAQKGKSASLKAPSLGLMTSRSIESIDSSISLRLFDKNTKSSKKELIFKDKGEYAGLELMDVKKLIESI